MAAAAAAEEKWICMGCFSSPSSGGPNCPDIETAYLLGYEDACSHDTRCRNCGRPPPPDERDRLLLREQNEILVRLAAALEAARGSAEGTPRQEPALPDVPTCSIAEAKMALGCGRTKVFELIAEGSLAAVKHGKERRLLKASVEELVRSGVSLRRPRRARARRTERTVVANASADKVAKAIEDLLP